METIGKGRQETKGEDHREENQHRKQLKDNRLGKKSAITCVCVSVKMGQTDECVAQVDGRTDGQCLDGS